MQKLLLKVVRVHDETPTIRSVRLALAGEGAFSFKPGQYCLFYVKNPVGKEISHSFSIASSPTRDYLEFATRSSESEFKRAFWQLKEGDEVKLLGPQGDFVYDEGIEHAVLLSGGIGITPLKSMLEYAADKRVSNKITLLFANRTPEEIPFKGELDAAAKANPNMRIIYTVSDLAPNAQWDGRRGRVDGAMIREFAADAEMATFFICGPPGMVDALAEMLEKMGVARERVRIEHFEGYT